MPCTGSLCTLSRCAGKKFFLFITLSSLHWRRKQVACMFGVRRHVHVPKSRRPRVRQVKHRRGPRADRRTVRSSLACFLIRRVRYVMQIHARASHIDLLHCSCTKFRTFGVTVVCGQIARSEAKCPGVPHSSLLHCVFRCAKHYYCVT